MFFSKGKDQPQEAANASSSASASTTMGSPKPSTSRVDEAEWQAKGAAGLGAISSLSPECTPLKHRYDACFNLWFKDYLAIGDDQIREQQRKSEASSSSPPSSSSSSSSMASSQSSGNKKRSSWFSDTSSSSSPASTTPTSLGEHDIEQRKKTIMERYERDCGKLFRDYQACVKVSTLHCSQLRIGVA